MKKIIINADDLGMSGTVNREIESCIQKGLITSTTIMANMPDFDGARKLYDTYNEAVSFLKDNKDVSNRVSALSNSFNDAGYFAGSLSKVGVTVKSTGELSVDTDSVGITLSKNSTCLHVEKLELTGRTSAVDN